MLKTTHLVGLAAQRRIVLSGLQCWLDALDYGSGQAWRDRVHGYEFLLGADGSGGSDEPAHVTGSPTYWSFDGGDFFTQADAYAGSIMRTLGRKDKPFTIEAWVYRGATANTNETLFANGSTSAGADAIRFCLDHTNNKMAMHAEGLEQGNSASQLGVGGWKHVALSGRHDGSTCTFYVSAEADGTYTFDMTGWASGDSASTPEIGRAPGGTPDDYLQNGSRLAVLRLYSRALPGSEIAHNFAAERARFGV